MDKKLTSNSLVKEAEQKRQETLHSWKVRRTARILNRKAQLEDEMKRLDAAIEEIANTTHLPEGESIDF